MRADHHLEIRVIFDALTRIGMKRRVVMNRVIERMGLDDLSLEEGFTGRERIAETRSYNRGQEGSKNVPQSRAIAFDCIFGHSLDKMRRPLGAEARRNFGEFIIDNKHKNRVGNIKVIILGQKVATKKLLP